MEDNSQQPSPHIKENSLSQNNPVVNQPGQGSRPSASKQYKRPLVIIGVLLGFVLFGVGGYLLGVQKSSQIGTINDSSSLTQSPTPTLTVTPSSIDRSISNWETFYSQTYDITLKYPEGWKAEEGRLNHLGVENKDVIPCGDTWNKYFKSPDSCDTDEVDAPYIEVFKLEPDTDAETNIIIFSVMQYDKEMGSDGYFETDTFELKDKEIHIGNQKLTQTSFSGFTTPAYNKGFQVRGINTGNKSIFSKLNVFAAARPTKLEYSELETLERILYSLQN